MKYPVKFPVVLAILSVFVAPLLSVLYAGLIAMDFSGWLKIFDPVRTVLDLVQAGLFLCFTLGTLFLLWSLRQYVKKWRCKKCSCVAYFPPAFYCGIARSCACYCSVFSFPRKYPLVLTVVHFL